MIYCFGCHEEIEIGDNAVITMYAGDERVPFDIRAHSRCKKTVNFLLAQGAFFWDKPRSPHNFGKCILCEEELDPRDDDPTLPRYDAFEVLVGGVGGVMMQKCVHPRCRKAGLAAVQFSKGEQ